MPMNPTTNDSRPRIWVEGSQHPPFDARAFGLASVRYARESLSGLCARCAESAQGFSQVVATGRWRIPESRLGRTGRYLPSVEATARAIGGAADVLGRASRVARPEDEAATELPSIFDAPDPVRRLRLVEDAREPLTPATAADAIDPDAEAIRQALAGHTEEAMPAATEATADATVVKQRRRAAIKDRLAQAAALMLGYGLLVVSVPFGAFRAGVAHLNGEDLRKVVDEG